MRHSFFVEIFTFCLLLHSYIQPAVLPSIFICSPDHLPLFHGQLVLNHLSPCTRGIWTFLLCLHGSSLNKQTNIKLSCILENWDIAVEFFLMSKQRKTLMTSSNRNQRPSWTSQSKPYSVHLLTCRWQGDADHVMQAQLHGLHQLGDQDHHV